LILLDGEKFDNPDSILKRISTQLILEIFLYSQPKSRRCDQY